MSFPLGKPILVMIAVALISGVAIMLRHAPQRAELRVWVFADSHARAYRGDDPNGSPGSLIDLYRQRTGKSVRVDLISARALDTRLISLFMSDSPRSADDLPDLVEIEIGSVGKYFRPPVDAVGLLPLNSYLEKSGSKDRLIPERLAPWTKDGVIFGVPHDVHPVTITYRKDLFDGAGIDLASAKTWAEFHSRCLAFQSYQRSHGKPHSYAIELPTNSADVLTMMLLQRGVNVLDDRNRVHLADPRVAATIAFYAQLVAGPKRIGDDSTAGAALWTRDLAAGDLCAAFTPDWRVGDLRNYAPDLDGKLAMMPLPRFESTDAPTSTWGGTMICIPRNCRQPDRAWELLNFLYFSPEALEARRRYTEIIPPLKTAYDRTMPSAPGTFFHGQDVRLLYAELALRIPARYVTPFTSLASGQLTNVLRNSIAYIESHDGNTDGLESACQGWLNDAAKELERWIDFGTVTR